MLLAIWLAASSGWATAPTRSGALSWRRAQPPLALRRAQLLAIELPAGIEDGFLGDADARIEAEQQLGVTLSDDVSLWEDNAFMEYCGGEWKQTSVDRVVLLSTFIALKFLAKLTYEMAPYTFDEFADTVLGRRENNKWKVCGYISTRSRIVRSIEGVSYGQWFLQTLEPDASRTVMKFEMLPANGLGCVLGFERDA